MSTEEDWTLTRTKGGKGIEPNEPVEIQCTELQAIALLESGDARLKKSPINPPQHLLDLLNARVHMIENLGPEISDPKIYGRIVEKVFKDSVRQTIVDGNTLRWRHGKIKLRQLAGRYLSQCSDPNCDLFFHFRLATFEGSFWTAAAFNSISDKVYGLELNRSAPALMNSLAVHAAAVLVPSGSMEFTYEALKLQGLFEVAIDRAISSGRIIVGQETPAGDRFVAPDAAAGLTREEMDDGYFFLPSIELPTSVIASNTLLHRKKIIAKAWIKKVCEHFSNLDRRPSQKDMVTVMCEKFELTENAASDALKESEWPTVWKSGRISDAQKVKINEIKSLN